MDLLIRFSFNRRSHLGNEKKETSPIDRLVSLLFKEQNISTACTITTAKLTDTLRSIGSLKPNWTAGIALT